ncbi:MAG: hypothetical protein AAF193_10595 [Bacteroidota bacterium]
MSILKLRIVADTEEDIFRDIEINAEDSFEALHKPILAAFDFEDGEMASFYMSNEQWERGEEIPLMDMGPDAKGNELPNMQNTLLKDRITEPDQKVVYVYDFLRMWCFYIEVLEWKKRALSTIYPRVDMVFGASPDQNSKELDLFDEFPLDESKPTSTGDPEIDAYLADEGDDQPGFESLDDLGDEYY